QKEGTAEENSRSERDREDFSFSGPVCEVLVNDLTCTAVPHDHLVDEDLGFRAPESERGRLFASEWRVLGRPIVDYHHHFVRREGKLGAIPSILLEADLWELLPGEKASFISRV